MIVRNPTPETEFVDRLAALARNIWLRFPPHPPCDAALVALLVSGDRRESLQGKPRLALHKLGVLLSCTSQNPLTGFSGAFGMLKVNRMRPMFLASWKAFYGTAESP